MILLTALLPFLIFTPSLRGEFVFDDASLFKMKDKFKNGIYTTWALWFRNNRALTCVTYQWSWRIGDFRPLWWHLPNLVVHSAVIALIYRIAGQLQFSKDTALIASLLFAVHPLGAGAVCYISARAGMLGAVFAFSGLTLFLDGQFSTAILAQYLSNKCKEDSIFYATSYPIAYVFAGGI